MITKLETKRLILRKPKSKDWKPIYEQTDNNAIKNFLMPYPYLKKHARESISQRIKDWSKGSYWMIIELKRTLQN